MRPSSHIARYAFTAAVVGAVLCGPLSADAEKARVLVVPYAPLYDSIPRATGEQIAETLETSLANQDAVEVVKLPTESEGAAIAAASEQQLAAVQQATEALARGESQLARRRVRQAIDAFDEAIRGMEANGPALLDVRPLVQAYLKKSVALFLMGREDEALATTIPAALRLAPEVRLEAGQEYQQVFIDHVEKVRADLQKVGYGQLKVDTTPPGAQIWLDEREANYSPVDVNGILPGTHYVKIKPPGADPYMQVIEIEAGKTFHITPDDGKRSEGPIGSLVTQLSQNQLNAGVVQQIGALVKKHGATHAVIGGAFAQGANMGIVSFLYADGALTEVQRITLDRDMLGAAIEINRVAADVVAKVAAPSPVQLDRAVAADARPGEEERNLVDFSGALAAGAAGSSKAGAAVQPAATERKGPITRDRRPIGGKKPVGGGGSAPEAAAPATQTPATEQARRPTVTADEPNLGFQDEEDFGAPAAATEAPRYQYSAGTGIEDEGAFGNQNYRSEGGLLSKWWFWTGAAVLAAGAVGVGVGLAGGGSDGATGTITWK